MIKPTYPIKTPRLYLRPFADEDIQEMFKYHSRPDVTIFFYWNPRIIEETKAALETKKSQVAFTAEGSVISLAVCLNATQQLIGEVTLFWRSAEHKQGEIGFVFNPQFGGHGYATEAAMAMLTLGFAHCDFHRIYGSCDARNIASYKVMARLGMRREAHFVQNEIFKGEWGDELVYAILNHEWKASQTE